LENRQVQSEEYGDNCQDKKRFIVNCWEKTLCDKNKDHHGEQYLGIEPHKWPPKHEGGAQKSRRNKKEDFFGIKKKRTDIHN